MQILPFQIPARIRGMQTPIALPAIKNFSNAFRPFISHHIGWRYGWEYHQQRFETLSFDVEIMFSIRRLISTLP